MISAIEPTSGKGAVRLYQLEIVLLGCEPAVSRRLQVPATANLGWLHAVLQVAMGWTNSHLHQFEIGGDCYSDTRHYSARYEGDPEILDERKFTLQKLFPAEKISCGYEYDFGDSWAHEITVLKVLPPDAAAAKSALCLGGTGACPPEDCGGIGGYIELQRALKNRRHPEHQTMKEWLGRPLDPEAFDPVKVNTYLRKLKWPHVTVAQLRKILMDRDGYHE